eukprot:TRINITY_DN2698_c0_g1_i2.p1 TRINITY_DN2698_c0_g1~~TRINITY_DN2698_c0_g1_i2.p1  ORF type:complete len:442 (+),score=45.62 TRINITY_DN2698_c0_g1_i2:1323-2648(+)
MKSKSLLVLLAGAALGTAASANSDQAYRAEMLADAEQRSSLLAAGATVTHDDGHFTFTDASGNNSMALGLFGQVRYLFNFGDEERFGGSGDDADGDIVNGFQVSRVKLFAGGTVGSPDFEYYFQFGAAGLYTDGSSSSSSGSMGALTLEDFWGKFNFENGGHIRVGQGRPSQGFEAMYQPWELQSFERSIAHALFAYDRTQFIEYGYQSEDQTWDFAVFISDGARQEGVNYNSSTEADIGIGGRGNWYFAGDASDFGMQSSSADRADYAGRAGVGVFWDTYGETGIGTSDLDLWGINADVEVKGEAWSAGAYFYLLNVDPDSGDDGTHFGFRARGGFNATEQAELYAFWDSIFLDEDVLGGSDVEDNFNFLGFGANYYPIADSHAVQLGAEVIISLDDTTDLFGGLSDITVGGSGPDFTLYNLLSDEDTEFGIGVELSVLN